jgi:hypothetical protein
LRGLSERIVQASRQAELAAPFLPNESYESIIRHIDACTNVIQARPTIYDKPLDMLDARVSKVMLGSVVVRVSLRGILRDFELA